MYFHMSVRKFGNLLKILGQELTKQNSKWRQSVSPEERLALTKKYLGSKDSQISLSFSYSLDPSTVNSIIFQTCKAIKEMPEPTGEMWRKMTDDFYSMWQFPNCIGAIDGKHFEIQTPKNSGSLYFNYKKCLEQSCLNIPEPRPVLNSTETYPFSIVGDKAFPLGWRKLHNEELYNVYSSPSIIRMIKSRAGHVARMGETRNAYRILVGKRPQGRPRRRWVYNIRMDLRDIGWDGMDWIDLAQDRDQWRALANTVMNLRVP
ncbi:hypothetical protein B7P43_G01933 [Cryptotermes secundus]|uniref:DDE Tnp4 domain-containing protein n=1 Tax=Cryptotermes secundus TaxID=105785 RepID=A0A2J7QLQ0_9NEOP|nr:hypothetical protein B7P43_G01933 [Cryptotermes secundus]